jgi:hypothetical protein
MAHLERWRVIERPELVGYRAGDFFSAMTRIDAPKT